MIHESGTPGPTCPGNYKTWDTNYKTWDTNIDIDTCALHARELGALVFAFGKGMKRTGNVGECVAFDITVTKQMWQDWQQKGTDSNPCSGELYADNQYLDTFD